MSDHHDYRADGVGPDTGGAAERDHAMPDLSMLTPQAVDGLADMLTVVLVSLEQLTRGPLTQRASHRLARADVAAHRARALLWQALDAGAGFDGAALRHRASVLELRL